MEQSQVSNNKTNFNKVDINNFFSPFVKLDQKKNNSIVFKVQNIHCASCINLIEKSLYKLSNVIFARVNMSTEKLEVKWTGEKKLADKFAKILSDLGYPVTLYDHDNLDKNTEDNKKILIRSIAVSGFAAGNLMLISVGLWSSSVETMGFATRELFQWISSLIVMPAIIYSGRPFFYSAFKVLKNKKTNMDVPISLAVILTSLISLFETINSGEHIYFDSAIMLLFFLLIGRYLDVLAKGKAKKSANELLSTLGGTATVIKNEKHVIVPIKDLKAGDVISISVGEKIPADGIILSGSTEIDLSLISGETLPKKAIKNDNVFAGTLNVSAPIQIEVSKATENNLLTSIVKIMEKAELSKSKYTRIADKAAKLYTPIVHSAGFLTFIGWWIFIDLAWQPSLLIAVTVLIITCPCALGLAVPVVQVLAINLLMKKGIYIKSGDALEKLSKVKYVIFDKTGTLTEGKPNLIGSYSEKDIQIAASLAHYSKHPLSKAICERFNGKLLILDNVKEIIGGGIEGYFKGKLLKLGKKNWSCPLQKDEDNFFSEIWLNVDNNRQVCFSFKDQLRKDAKNVVNEIKKLGIIPIILSGDRKMIVKRIAQHLGIKDFHSEFSIEMKSEFIRTLRLKLNNEKILMIGDGLNDAPSLALSDVSIAPSTAMDITQNTADIVFQGDKLFPIISCIKISRKSVSLIKQNFLMAVIYNIFAIPMAVVGLVTPLIAAIAMSSSSLFVIGNSFRLNLKTRKFEL